MTTVYRIRLNDSRPTLEECRGLLSDVENARADRFIIEPPRIQYVVCRAALRKILGTQLDIDPRQVAFQQQRWGKPILYPQRMPRAAVDQTNSNEMHFNVSHSGDFGLIGISPQPIGVDIERLQPRIQPKSLVGQVLSPDERIAWDKLPASTTANQIIRLWVCKESLLKALGLGIAEALGQVDFALPIADSGRIELQHIDPMLQMHLDEQPDCRCNAWLLPGSWYCQSVEVDVDYFAVATTASSINHVNVVDFDW